MSFERDVHGVQTHGRARAADAADTRAYVRTRDARAQERRQELKLRSEREAARKQSKASFIVHHFIAYTHEACRFK